MGRIEKRIVKNGFGDNLGLTPVGWVVLIGIGVGAGFGAAYFTDNVAQRGTSWLYDKVGNL